MSANVYLVEDLLIGKFYRGSRGEGIIQSAEKRDDVWYDNAQGYLVRVRPHYVAGQILKDDFYATLAVAESE